MKSQVNALLHVLEGLCKDASLAYPALEADFSKDFERITLYCQARGIGFFTLDLPNLESCLLAGLESGRLVVTGPLSHRRFRGSSVPRLFSGLWLRVFDRDACLKQAVDVTALAFLRQFLVLGKKLELGCSHDRTQAIVKAYHDIEQKLRSPSLGWDSDCLFGDRESGGTSSTGSNPVEPPTDYQYSHLGYSDCGCANLLSGSLSKEIPVVDCQPLPIYEEEKHPDLDRLNLVQALDWTSYSNQSLPLFERMVDDEVRDKRVQDASLLIKVQQVADLIIGSFDFLDPVLYSENLEKESEGIGFRHGPGAVAERLKNWEKSEFPNWPHKLQQFFPYEQCGKTISADLERPLNHEVASRLIAVPKTTKGPRLIAAESTAHQWCQQLILRFLFEQCRKNFGSSFIDFKDQSKSGDLVLRASLDQSLATIDLSDASDRLSCWTVERIFRKNYSLIKALHAARTRYLRDDISDVPSFLKLKKFASQGTATTFPVMSIVMLCIALASSLQPGEEWATPSQGWRILRKYRNQVRVFGDDIIIPSHGYERLVCLMDLLQLKVNMAKSYVHGRFRESCGSDGFAGYNVTPVKPKTLVADRPASCQSVVDTSNNLFEKGFWHASTFCFDLLPARLRRGIRIVGRNDVGFRGLTSFTGSDESHLERRWNSRLHRNEVRVWSLLLQTFKRPRDGYPAFLDFIARKHNTEHARIVSEYADIRKTRIGLRWEPENTDARLSPLYPR